MNEIYPPIVFDDSHIKKDLENSKHCSSDVYRASMRLCLAVSTFDPDKIHHSLLEEKSIRAHVERMEGGVVIKVRHRFSVQAINEALRLHFAILSGSIPSNQTEFYIRIFPPRKEGA